MTTLRAALLLLAVALLAAGVLALVARTPAAVRESGGPGDTDPALGARFTDEQVARHGAFREAAYAGFVLVAAVNIVTLVILARGPLGRLVAALERVPGGWAVSAALAGAAVALVLAAASLPLGYVRRYAIQHAWNLSTQDLGGWVSDYSRATGVSVVIAAISAVAFFGIVRLQPRWWWVIGWIAFSLLNALLVYLWPVLIAPLFNKFTPLDEEPLKRRVLSLARSGHVSVDEVLVADASRRSTVENAYVAGLGNNKTLVLYDTLVESGDEDETAFVVAHELGHEIENHVLKNVLLSSAGLLVGFAVLGRLAMWRGPWEWAGATGVSDLRALPVLLLFAVVAGLLVLPIESSISRRFEARADAIAVSLTDDSGTAVRVFRRLAFSNLADLRPPPVAVWALFSHPPITERIKAVLRQPQPGAG